MTIRDARLLLLDRDGTLLLPPREGYVLNWSDVVLRQDVVQAVTHAARGGFVPVVVTNQSCVGRQITTQAWVDEVNSWIARIIVEGGGSLPLALSCPHVPVDDCDCRKPRPGMLQQAAELTGLPLSTAWMVGDSFADLGAARAARVERFLHVCPSGGSSVCAERDADCLPDFQALIRELGAGAD